MTVFDLLFIVLLLTAVGTLITAAVLAARGRRARALSTLGKLAFSAVLYIAFVYTATALSKESVLHVGDPECSDDWCIAVDSVARTPMGSVTRLEVGLRIFSRALRVSQRELVAKDVYLVDEHWRRYNPVPVAGEIPLNTLLQPGESKQTTRGFEVPADAHGLGLLVDRSSPPICLIIGECEAFHKATIVHLQD